MIRPATTADAAAIAGIYNHYVLNTVITFEEEPISVSEMTERIKEVTAALPCLVVVEEGKLLGYAYANKGKSRCAYRYSVESTVYFDPAATGRGLGTQLYTALIAELKQRSLHGIIAGVALPNAASVALHEKLGFQKIGQFKEVGWKFNQWIDVGYWELLL
jgi:L-amino acid N-acyltransferase YncA